jgi:PilZ domain
VQQSEQRQAERVPVEYTTEFRLHGDSDWMQGQIADMSEKGVRFRARCDLAPGTGLWLKIQPRDAVRTVVVLGSVVRCEPAGSADYEIACQLA